MPYDHPFQSRIRLDPAWPGTHSDGQEIKADPDLLDTLGQRLIGQASGMTSDQSYLPTSTSYFENSTNSTTVGLRNATQVPDGAQWFGGWPTGVLMEHSLACARSDIVYYYERLMEQVAAAGLLFKATATSYRAIDDGVSADLSQLGGWDQLRGTAGATGQAQQEALQATAPPASGSLHEFAEIPYIDQYEEVGQYDPNWVLEQIERLRTIQPWGQLQSIGEAFHSAGDRLDSLSTMLRNCAESLVGEWDSDTSVACQKALRQITATAEHLATSCHQLSDFSYRSAETIQETVSGFPTEVDGRGIGEWLQDTVTIGDSPNLKAKHNEIRDALARLNDSYRTINYTTLPAEVGVDIPLLPGADDRKRTWEAYDRPDSPALPSPPLSPTSTSAGATVHSLPAGTGITGFPTGSTGAALVVGSGNGEIPGFAATPAGMEVDAAGPDGGLAGAVPGAGPATPNALSPVAGAPAGGPPAAGLNPGPMAALGSPGGAGGVTGGRGGATGTPRGGAGNAQSPMRGGGASGVGGRPGSGVMPLGNTATNGRDGGRHTSRGAASGARTHLTAGGTRSATAGNMLPMSGRRGDAEEENDRDTWLLEDEDPWGNDHEAPPPVIR